MPEHRLLAVLRVLEVDPITHQMGPEALEAETLVEKAEHRKGVEHLLHALVHQVLAVSIENQAIALQHIHHLQQMVRSVLEQRPIAEQTADQLLLIRKHRGLNEGR